MAVGICGSCGQELPDVEEYKKQLKGKITDLEKKLEDLRLEGSRPRDELMTKITRMDKFRSDSMMKENLLKLNQRWVSEMQDMQNFDEQISILEERIITSDVAEEDIKKLNQSQIEIKSKIANLREKHTKITETISLTNSEIGFLERNSKSRTVNDLEFNVKDILGKLSTTLEQTIESYLEKAREKSNKHPVMFLMR